MRGELGVAEAVGTGAGVGVAGVGDDAVERAAGGEVLLTEQHGRGFDGIRRERAGSGAGTQRKEEREVEALQVVFVANIAGHSGRFEAGDIGDAGAIRGNYELSH